MKKLLTPVKPARLELVYFYPCPFCEQQVPVIKPVEPTRIRCDGCGERFPIVPVDKRSIQYVSIMLANGKAAIDPDFV